MINLLLPWIDSWQFSVCLIVVQIAILILFAWGINVLLKQNPGYRHFVWKVSLIAAILIVPLRWCMPSWQVEIEQASPLLVMQNLEAEHPQVALENLSENIYVDLPVQPLGPDQASVPQVDTAVEQKSDATSLRISNLDEMESTEVVVSPVSWPSLKTWLIGSYLFVVVLLTLRLLVAFYRLRILSSSGVCEREVVELANDVSDKVGLNRLPRTVVSPKVASPMVFGLLRSTVVLPSQFAEWSRESQQAVLAHEFCHVKRHDALWDLLAAGVRIVYWFHPAVVFAHRRLRKERELATDQAVLRMGFTPSSYATALLKVGTEVGQGSRECALAVPMASETNLSSRIQKVLLFNGEGVPSKIVTWSTRVLACMVLVGIAGFSLDLALAEPADNSPAVVAIEKEQDETASKLTRSNPQFPEAVDNESVRGDNFYSRILQTQVNPDYATKAKSPVKISGTVIGVDGQPAANSVVVIRNSSAVSSIYRTRVHGVMAKTRTDSKGFFEFGAVKVIGKHLKPQVLAVAESGAIAWESFFFRNDIAVDKEVTLKLEPANKISGRLVDPDGKPVKSARLVYSYSRARNRSGRGMKSLGAHHCVISPTTESDSNGRFEFSALPADCAISIVVQHPDYPDNYINIARSESVIRDAKSWGNVSSVVNLSGDTIKLDKGIVVTGVVTDEAGAPCLDAWVMFASFENSVKVDNETGGFRVKLLTKMLERMGKDDRFGELRVFIKDEGIVYRKKFSEEQFREGNLELKLADMATLSGKVVSESGKPLEDVEVSIKFASDNAGRGSRYPCVTDENGEFEQKVTAGDLKIRLNGTLKGYNLIPGDGSLTRSVSLGLGEKKDLEPIVVKQLGSIRVVLKDENNTPVEGAQVRLLTVEKRGWYAGDLGAKDFGAEISGPDGVANLVPSTKPAEGSVAYARFEKDGKLYFGDAKVDVDEMAATIQIKPAVMASGKVTLNGQPLKNVELDFSLSIPNETIPGIHSSRALSRRIGIARTDHKGGFQKMVPASNLNDDLAEIFVGVRAGIPNKESGGRSLRMNFDGVSFARDFDFAEGSGRISGTVVDEQGQPIGGVAVYVAQNFKAKRENMRDLRFRLYQPALVYTDADGKFCLQGLPEELEYLIRTGSREQRTRVEYTTVERTVTAGTNDLKFVVSAIEEDK